MKKQLMATTALVAGGLIAGAAQAAEPIKLTLGGYITTGLTVRDQDHVATAAGADDRVPTTVAVTNAAGGTTNIPTTTDLGRTDQFWEAEVWFVGETTLDNGIKVGVNIQMEAYTSNDQIDEHYIYVQGGFGRLVAGAENSAPYIMHYAAPSPSGGQFGADSPNFLPFRNPPSNRTGGTVRTFMQLTSDANKITYYTPRFAPGFQFGISYTPDDDAPQGVQTVYGNNCRGGCAFGAGNGISDNDASTGSTGSNHHHFVEAGANFVRSINGVDLAFDVGFGTGFVEKQVRSTTVTGLDRTLKQRYSASAGFNVGYAGWTFGAGWLWDNQGQQGPNDRNDITAGVTYGAGPWLVGVNVGYAWVQDGERLVAHPVTGSALVRRTNDTLLYGELGGQYTLGPGIRVFSVINYAKYDGNDTATEESTGVAWSTGFRLSF